MNKKQMLKEQKKIKEERRQTQYLFNDDKEVYNVFKIGLGVILFIGFVFVAINIFNGNWNLFNKSNIKEATIDPSMVIVGTMFNKSEDDYLVLAYDMQDDSNAFYAALAEKYAGNLSMYYLDLSSGFNKAFLGDKTVISNDLKTLKFSGPALLVINNDKIIKSYTTESAIVNYFSSK